MEHHVPALAHLSFVLVPVPCLYLYLDMWSRNAAGWRVDDREDNELPAQAFVDICRTEDLDTGKLVCTPTMRQR